VLCREWVDPPSGERPNAIATPSTIVDLPEPFSPDEEGHARGEVEAFAHELRYRRDGHRPLARGQDSIGSHLDAQHRRLVEVHAGTLRLVTLSS